MTALMKGLVVASVVWIALALAVGTVKAQQGTPDGGDLTMAHHPAYIRPGSCAQLSAEPAFTLSEIGMNMEGNDAGSAIGVEISSTTVEIALNDLLAEPFAIDVQEVKELGDVFAGTIACGDLGGQSTGDLLAVGIHEENDSGFSGIAVFQAADSKTIVTLYMAHGLSGHMHDEMVPEATP